MWSHIDVIRRHVVKKCRCDTYEAAEAVDSRGERKSSTEQRNEEEEEHERWRKPERAEEEEEDEEEEKNYMSGGREEIVISSLRIGNRIRPSRSSSPQVTSSLSTCLSVSRPDLQSILQLWQKGRKVWLQGQEENTTCGHLTGILQSQVWF